MTKKVSLKTVRKILSHLLVVVLCLGAGFWLGQRQNQLSRVDSFSSALEMVKNKDSNPENLDFMQFWNVWNDLEQNYLDPKAIDASKMINGSIEGMVSSLGDPYTIYLPPAENKQTGEDLKGQFAGVGIELGYIDHTLAVMAPLADQPAIKAGIKAGDLIIHIKDEKKKIDIDTDGMSLAGAVQNIRGNVGDPVTLTIYRDGDKKPMEITLIRQMIVVPSVALKFVDSDGKEVESGEFAHLRVSKFGDKTAKEWDDAVTKILAHVQTKGIVLDLRNNPGGFLQRAIDLASEFIPSGVVVQQAGRSSTQTFTVDRSGRLIGKNLVVLINKGSASASEILAGALREDLGTKLIGENSFGKGTVQEAKDLPGGGGLHITIAKWLLPHGTNIHKVGLKPDIEVVIEEASGSAKPSDLAGKPADNQLLRAIQELNK